ncbi:MAG: phage tail spike protein [Bacillus sp. (in: firmicutes)]|uniref:phage tail spike protein n=1 Tax=Bacillus sp. TaxID=1409 RepID=UPI0039E600F4
MNVGDILLKLYNKQMQLKAYLENAYNVKYNPPLNELWTAGFSLPLIDPKREEIETFDYVEIFDNGKRIGMFRIMDSVEERDAENKIISYECEHVLSTLMDSVLFGYHQRVNLTTRENIEYLLSKQRIKHWKLGQCDFVRYFHYAWENESTLLGPLYSIPRPFDEKYQWTWDDSSYPWTLNIVRYSPEITGELRYKKSMKGIKRTTEAKNVMTRIYPLGYGEGVNQLTIKDVNGGVPYIDAPGFIRDLYDGFDYIWVDRRFEDPQSLYDSANMMLLKSCVPKVTYEIDAVDYELIDPYKIEKYETGKLVRLYDEELGIWVDLRVMNHSKDDADGNPLAVKLTLENRVTDIGTTYADIEKRQQINEVYSQGCTTMIAYSYNDNCDPENPAVIKFFIPDDLKNINTLDLTFETEEFRAYSRATKGGGAQVATTGGGGGTVATTGGGGGTVATTGGGGATVSTTGSGGGSVETSSAGGGGSFTSEAGGGSVASSSNGGNHRHMMFGFQSTIGDNTGGMEYRNYISAIDDGGGAIGSALPTGAEMDLWTYTADGNHSHTTSIPSHRHQVNVPQHAHTLTLPMHSHSITLSDHVHSLVLQDHVHSLTLQDHVHTVILPDHVHDILFGIYRLSERPSKVTIKVDGNVVPVTSVSAENVNLEPYLSKDNSGKIERNKWHVITITPDKLGRVNANVISRLFIQSRSGGTF